MSVALTLADAALMMREAVRDKSYRATPVGREIGHYLRAYRFAGASKNTIDSYELVLARLALDHADFETLERFLPPVGVEYLREFLDRHWGDASKATRAHRLAVIRSFFKWAHEEGRLEANPTLTIKGPRGRRSGRRRAHERERMKQLIRAQDSLRDQCALQLLCRLGLRKNDLRLLQVKDVDLGRGELVLRHGKGGKQDTLPIVYPDLRDDLYLHIVGEQRGGDEYLLYPKADRRRPMDPASVHRWFKRCLDLAGLPDMPMHETRHTAADEMWRETGNIVLAQQLLRHESVGTTQDYLHPSREDLAAGMRLVDEKWRSE